MQNHAPSPLKADDVLSNHFAGTLSFSILMDLRPNVFNIQLLFPYPQLHMDWSSTKHRRKEGEQDLTSGIDWIDSTKLSSNDSQIASFTATQRWQSRRLWEIHMLSSNSNFKSANRLLQDMLMLTDLTCSKLQFVLYNHCSCTNGQIWAGHWHSSAHRSSFTMSTAFFSDPAEFLLQLLSCVFKCSTVCVSPQQIAFQGGWR